MRFKIITLLLCSSVGMCLYSCKPSTKSAQQQQTAATPDIPIQHPAADTAAKTQLIGVWYDESLKLEQGQHVAYELVSSNKKTYIQVITFSGKKLNVNDNPDLSSSATELKRSGEKYVSIERPNEIYAFDKSGSLLVYDETGLIMKCKRML